VSGLPDEAVEAIWMTLRERFGIDADLRRIPVEDVVAALPAGVYVSDGKGNVEPVALSVVKDAIDEYVESCREVSEPVYTEEIADHVVAALSATDTEGAA
jgi:hypothetical protein